MDAKKRVMFGVMSLALAGLINAVHATPITIDRFQIISSTSSGSASTLFVDEFLDGVPPPTGGTSTSDYFVRGTLGPESGGRLTMDDSGLIAQTTAVGAPALLQAAAHRSNIDPTDPFAGLKSTDSFNEVFGIFDLVDPLSLGESYGIRFTDRIKTLGFEGNDILELAVRRTLEDELFIDLREINFIDETVTILDQIALDLAHDQILLDLFWVSGRGLTAGYNYIDGGSASGFNTLDVGLAAIFEGENWTRGQFFHRILATPVPEPSTMALMLIGLLSIPFLRRYK